MKIDQKLVKKIMLAVEACPSQHGIMWPLEIPGYDAKTISYHVQVLREAGMLFAENNGELGLGHIGWDNVMLTAKGREGIRNKWIKQFAVLAWSTTGKIVLGVIIGAAGTVVGGYILRRCGWN